MVGGETHPASSIGSKLRFVFKDEYSNPDGDVDFPLAVVNCNIFSIADFDNNLSIGEECLKRIVMGVCCIDKEVVATSDAYAAALLFALSKTPMSRPWILFLFVNTLLAMSFKCL